MFKRLLRFFVDKRPPQPVSTNAAEPADAPPVRDHGLLALLAQVLESEGLAPVLQDGHLVLGNGLQVFVELLDVVELPPDGIRTATTIQVRHRTLFPDGIAEFQHAWGPDIEQSLVSGFATWARTDLVALSEAVSAAQQERHCMTLQLGFPPPAAHRREVVLGPVAHLGGAAQAAACDVGDVDEAGHAFCPCCLFTQSLEAFMPVLENDARMLGIRLFASRDAEGEVAADCRINGVDFAEGAECLRRYAATWPAHPGLEFRKQYVVVRPPDAPAAPLVPDVAS
ncbi:hypothetical protein HEP73_04076 [Xanthomonas sp. GW]|uniref:DUF6348 family protein n=1 Tax=Xanthomonas sp. GW TaxID=2724121 RepID=UPI00163A0B93|nr:DUF6348 family protein [Xanthomonas sp. GW]QNH23125.1 hypothetical protein HEP73_04076 [Xanthomonas sp. GW]